MPRWTDKPVISSNSRTLELPSIRESTKYSSGPMLAVIGLNERFGVGFCDDGPIPGMSAGTALTLTWRRYHAPGAPPLGV